MFNSIYVQFNICTYIDAIGPTESRPDRGGFPPVSYSERTATSMRRLCDRSRATGRERQVESDRSRATATGRERQRQVESDRSRATGRERQVESDRSRATATGRERQRQVESDRSRATGRERQVESDRSKTARPGDRLGAHRNALPIGNDRQGVSTGDGSGWRYADISKARLNALVLSAAPTPSTTFSNLFSARCAPFRPRVRVSWSTANVTADHS
jgi:hypothetical protein